VFQGDKVRVVQTLLFVEGINTLLQTLFGTRLPTVIGGSYAFMVPIVSIIHDPSLTKIPDDHLVSLVFLFFFYSSEYSRKSFTLQLSPSWEPRRIKRSLSSTLLWPTHLIGFTIYKAVLYLNSPNPSQIK
jgi:hypothetical protein